MTEAIFKPIRWGAEVLAVLRLALPLVAAELGWMLQGIVDTIMVGRMPEAASAIGGSAVGASVFYTTGIFFGSLLLGMDPLVSQAFGAGRLRDCHRTLVNGLWLMLGLSPVLMAIVLGMIPVLTAMGLHPAVVAQADPFMRALVWGTPPLLLFFALRHYFQCLNYAKMVMFILLTANLVNWFLNWVLIFGQLGAPAMGVRGSAWSTVIARVYMLALAVAYLLYVDRRDRLGLFTVSLRPALAEMRLIIRYGLPAAVQMGLELAVFLIAALLIGKLGPVPLAGHQIALMVVAFTYMVPLGIGAAAAVMVGQAIGAGDMGSARRAGWISIALGAAFMSCCGVVLITAPRAVVRIFTADPAVVAAGTSLVMVGAAFQLFDGIQTVATGALRGAGETRLPMFTFLFGYWSLGVPLGWWLAFRGGWGAKGLWVGFCAALISIGLVLLGVWGWRSNRLRSVV